MGKGTGLGLSMVIGIVEQSGGHVWVYSEPERGATFKLYFPVVDAALDARAKQVPALRLVGAGTVLLVEDDEQVRTLVRGVLTKAGYSVLDAASAKSALAVASEASLEIDVLLTDVVMPQMNGRQLAEELWVIRPELKVLYMSGYTDDAVMRNGGLAAGAAFIQKPIMPDALLTQLQRVIDAPSA